MPLDEKLRQAYFWIVNTAIISPHYDIEYNDGPPQSFAMGDSKSRLTLPSAQSYSSFVLLPLLTFAARRKCLFIGGPERGKAASAILLVDENARRYLGGMVTVSVGHCQRDLVEAVAFCAQDQDSFTCLGNSGHSFDAFAGRVALGMKI